MLTYRRENAGNSRIESRITDRHYTYCILLSYRRGSVLKIDKCARVLPHTKELLVQIWMHVRWKRKQIKNAFVTLSIPIFLLLLCRCVGVYVCVRYLHTTKSWENLIQLCCMGKAELRKTNIIFHLNSPFKYRERHCLFVKLKINIS